MDGWELPLFEPRLARKLAKAVLALVLVSAGPLAPLETSAREAAELLEGVCNRSQDATQSAGTSTWLVPHAAWSRNLGDIPPRAAGPAKRGIPLGGFGAGSMMYNLAGTFGPWELYPGHRADFYPPQAAFHFWERASGGTARARTLATDDVLPAWPRLQKGDAQYHALFPKAWVTYKAFCSVVSLKVFSPIVKDNYRETSYPVAVFQFLVANPTTDAYQVSVMFTFPNLPYARPVSVWAMATARATGSSDSGSGITWLAGAALDTPVLSGRQTARISWEQRMAHRVIALENGFTGTERAVSRWRVMVRSGAPGKERWLAGVEAVSHPEAYVWAEWVKRTNGGAPTKAPEFWRSRLGGGWRNGSLGLRLMLERGGRLAGSGVTWIVQTAAGSPGNTGGLSALAVSTGEMACPVGESLPVLVFASGIGSESPGVQWMVGVKLSVERRLAVVPAAWVSEATWGIPFGCGNPRRAGKPLRQGLTRWAASHPTARAGG